MCNKDYVCPINNVASPSQAAKHLPLVRVLSTLSTVINLLINGRFVNKIDWFVAWVQVSIAKGAFVMLICIIHQAEY